MNTDTGQIKNLSELTDAEKKSGKWRELAPDQVKEYEALSPEERVKKLAAESLERASQAEPGTRYFNATIRPTPPIDKRKSRRKMQKLSRKRNRG